MTDKQIIETLRNISNFCNGRFCALCKFHSGHTDNPICDLGKLAKELTKEPYQWDMEKIESIVKGERR